MAYVSTNSEFFKVIKREFYAYLEHRAAAARDLGKEFQRPMISDGALQVLIDVLQQRRNGKKDAEVPIVMNKVNYSTRGFLKDFLEELPIDTFVRTSIVLPEGDQSKFLEDVRMLAKVPPARRQALLDVIRSLLPKVEGLHMKTEFVKALDAGDARQFIEFTDVIEAGITAE